MAYFNARVNLINYNALKRKKILAEIDAECFEIKILYRLLFYSLLSCTRLLKSTSTHKTREIHKSNTQMILFV
jgi:hypothetical protein